MVIRGQSPFFFLCTLLLYLSTNCMLLYLSTNCMLLPCLVLLFTGRLHQADQTVARLRAEQELGSMREELLQQQVAIDLDARSSD